MALGKNLKLFVEYKPVKICVVRYPSSLRVPSIEFLKVGATLFVVLISK
jgi:hypothetical protein